MDLIIVSLIVVAAVVLFAWEKFTPDVVAMMVLAALLLAGLVSPTEAVSGFSNPATVTVAAMFVLSAGLNRTGALAAMGQILVRHSRGEVSLLLMIMLGVGVISPFINNTAAVAVFLPLVVAAAAARKISTSRLLIPLSYASQFGGVCTLIGTSTNLLVNSIALDAGLKGFSMFEFSVLGLVMVAAGFLYILTIGRFLLPNRRQGKLTEDYSVGEYLTEMRVFAGSPLIGKSVIEADLSQKHDITVLEIIRGERKIWSPLSEPLKEEDLLLVRGEVQQLFELKNRLGLEMEAESKWSKDTLGREELDLVEGMIMPGSPLANHTLKELNFRDRFKVVVLALHRRGELLKRKLSNLRLREGDALLMLGPTEEIARLRSNDSLVLLGQRRDVVLNRKQAPIALGIVAAVVLLAAFNVLPIMVSSLLGCVVMVITRCLRADEVYQAIDWKIVVLLAAILPLGLALRNSGAAEWVVKNAMGGLGNAHPMILIGLIYLVTAILTEFMSNNAAAVLVAPVAISTAQSLGLDPRPFLVAVAFAASTSFATPVGYQTNSMVYNAGGYRFTDFIKIGVPLNVIFCLLAAYLIPKLWPLGPVVP